MSEHIITLADIRAHGPCEDGWRKLISALGTSDPTTRLTIGDVARSNGAVDAIWCLRCIDDPRVRVAAIMPAVRRAAVHTTDQRVHDCIAAVERWLAGDDGVDLLEARAAAEAAEAAEATEAALAARAAAWVVAAAEAEAAWAAARAAAWVVALVAAWVVAAAEAEAAWAATTAKAEAATEAAAAEREHQREDLIAMFGLLTMEGK